MEEDWKPLLSVLAVYGILWVLIITIRNKEEVWKDLNTKLTFIKYG